MTPFPLFPVTVTVTVCVLFPLTYIPCNCDAVCLTSFRLYSRSPFPHFIYSTQSLAGTILVSRKPSHIKPSALLYLRLTRLFKFLIFIFNIFVTPFLLHPLIPFNTTGHAYFERNNVSVYGGNGANRRRVNVLESITYAQSFSKLLNLSDSFSVCSLFPSLAVFLFFPFLPSTLLPLYLPVPTWSYCRFMQRLSSTIV